MQLPLSASALALLGVGAVLAGVLILVVLAVRRRMAASGSDQGPADRFAAWEGAGAMESAAQPAGPVALAAPPAVDEPAPQDEQPGPVPPLARPAAAAARPLEAPAKIDPPPDGVEPSPPARGADRPARHQAGSAGTVAAAVAQAFAVRASAGRSGTYGPGSRPPAGEGATEAAQLADDRVASPPESRPPLVPDARGREPDPAEDVPPSPDAEGRAAAAAPVSNGDGRADTLDQGNDGNGRPPASAPGSGLWATGWSAAPLAAATGQTGAAPDVASTPRPEHHGAARHSGNSASDARDRLLAVLLDDPERAVGAAVDLEVCLRELDRLSDAVLRERAALHDVLHRLAAAGLRAEQLARLAGMPLAEVEDLLGTAPAEHKA